MVPFAIREATTGDAAGIARVRNETWQAAYAGIVPQAHLDSLNLAAVTQRFARDLACPKPGRFILVAVADGAVVGFALAEPNRLTNPDTTGEVVALYVLPPFQRQGIGRALVREAACRLRAQGRSSLLIWVLEDNPARRFYEALGGRPVRTQPIAIGGATLTEVAYRWPDSSILG